MRQEIRAVLAAVAVWAVLPLQAGGGAAAEAEEPAPPAPKEEGNAGGDVKAIPRRGACEACVEARKKAEAEGGVQKCEQGPHKREGACWWAKVKDQARPFHCEACAKGSSESGKPSLCEACKAEREKHPRRARVGMKPMPKLDGEGEGKGGAGE